MKTVTMNRTISTNPKTPSALDVHGPRVEEDDLDVEDDEQHRGQVELDREPAAAERLRRRLDAALVGVELGPVVPARARRAARRRPRTARTPRPGRRARGSVRRARASAPPYGEDDHVPCRPERVVAVSTVDARVTSGTTSDRRCQPGQRVDDAVHRVAVPAVGQVAHEPQHGSHQRGCGRPCLVANRMTSRAADQLHEPRRAGGAGRSAALSRSG